MKVSADYRMLALDALRGKWRTAVLTGIAASALGATIVSSPESVVSNSNREKTSILNCSPSPMVVGCLPLCLSALVCGPSSH